MNETLEIPVKPDVLRWARETVARKPQDVATHLKLDVGIVLGWEQDRGHPTLPQLREMAKYLKRPLAAFFLPSAPSEPAMPGAFRRLPEDQSEAISQKTLLAIRRARRTQEFARELAENEGINEIELPIGTVTPSTNPSAVATRERERLGISMADQFRWSDKKVAYQQWKLCLEKRGMIVLDLPMPRKEARAFSLVDKLVPLIVINHADTEAAQIFSLFHEYGHLLLGRSGILDFTQEDRLSKEGRETERFCNQFAGVMLVPKSALMNTDIVGRHRTGTRWQDREISALASQFKVSEYVIVRRILAVALVTDAFYQEKAARYEEEAAQVPAHRGFGKRVPARMCLRENGVRYAGMVLRAHADERITYRDVADFLYVKTKYIEAVAGEMAGIHAS